MRDTIDMARKVYGANTEWTDSQLERLKQFEALVRADERALAAPVQEPFCFVYVENGEEYFAPKGAYVPDNAQALYTTPPTAQRQWVGLTDDERTEIRREHYARTLPLMDATEAKLRSKNNG